ncbi:glycosyltransferase family 4 protein [Pseudorhodoplanes sp.]|uniref:glycosyltransferase family 4 protein n=1 Tax=Pseudorhodoplanes sp. TaxID=1934341 RepID=UPI003D129D83
MSERTAGRLLFLVSEDWYFLSHRLPMARAARDAGYEVHVAARVGEGGARIAAEGFALHPLDWRRGSLNPHDLLGIVRQVRSLYRRLEPDLVHHVALQPSIVGSLAAAGMAFPRLNALAGLGFGFTSATLKGRLLRPVLGALLRALLNRPGAFVLVQNPDDAAAVRALGVAPERLFTIPGSGVDTDRLRPLPEPPGPVTAAFVGRLLDDKGVRPLIAAQAMLAARGEEVRLLIAGDRDPANPASIDAREIAAWKSRPGVTLLGHVDDIPGLWARAHIAVLPSRREGLPLSLLEAAACGRPIVATDVPGCREIARQGVNALLVPPDDAAALAEAIAALARDPQRRQRFAAAGRALVEREFSAAQIGRQIVAVYDHLLGAGRPLLPQAALHG